MSAENPAAGTTTTAPLPSGEVDASAPLLELSGVDIAAGDTLICHDISLTIRPGECHILLGPNGSGKSTLLGGIMGIHPFRIVSGTARLSGRDIAEMTVDERARAGVGMAFQRPPHLKGVSVERFAHAIRAKAALASAASDLGLTHLLERDVNAGFSGGEAKRWEVLKLALQGPSLCLLDEPESGVDLQHVGVVGDAVNRLLSEPDRSGQPRGALVITHTGFILDSLQADIAHLLVDGRIVASGDPREMLDSIRRNGYRAA